MPWRGDAMTARSLARHHDLRAEGLCQCGKPAERFWCCTECRRYRAAWAYIRRALKRPDFGGTIHVIGEIAVDKGLGFARKHRATFAFLNHRLYRVADGSELPMRPTARRRVGGRITRGCTTSNSRS